MTTTHIPYTVGHRVERRNHAHVASVDYRLSEKWGCQVGTAKSRRERALNDFLDTVEQCLAMHDTERLGHMLSLLDAALAGQHAPRIDAVYQADCADAEEELAQAEYRKNPCKQTARAWLDALGREARQNEPVMGELRTEWGL